MLLTTAQKVLLQMIGTDAKGNLAPLDASTPPNWTISDEALAHIDRNTGDVFTAYLIADAPGTIQVSGSADADLTAGVRMIAPQVALDFEIEPAEATTLQIQVGTPEPQ